MLLTLFSVSTTLEHQALGRARRAVEALMALRPETAFRRQADGSVLDVIERDNLKLNALTMGNYLLDGFRKLQLRYEAIGDVRGQGLFLGIELVTDRKTRVPATALAAETRARDDLASAEAMRNDPELRELAEEEISAAQTRLAELGSALEPGRLEQELVIWLQKLDVDEELDRLDSHLDELRRVLKQKEPVGRRLDFLLQEFNREANTLGSKSVDARTTNAAVELKVLIDQIREQVQNIE